MAAFWQNLNAEQEAFDALSSTLEHIPNVIENVRAANAGHFARFEKEEGVEMLGQMLAVTDGLIEGMLQDDEYLANDVPDDLQCDASLEEETGEADVPDSEIMGENVKPDAPSSSAIRTWTLSSYAQVLQQHRSCLKLLPHLLETVSYVFGANSAQVVALVLHRQVETSPEVLEDIVWLGRLVNFVVALVYKDDLCPEQNIFVKLVPHKRKLVGSTVVHDCYSLREAQLITAVSGNGEEKRLSYTYIGGGVTWQPPHSFPLVTRDLPLIVADRLMAIFALLGTTSLSRDLFVRRQNAELSDRLSPSDKEDEISDRLEQISGHTSATKRVFASQERMIAELFPETVDAVSLRCEHAFALPPGFACPYCAEPHLLQICIVCGDEREISPGVPCPLCAL